MFFKIRPRLRKHCKIQFVLIKNKADLERNFVINSREECPSFMVHFFNKLFKFLKACMKIMKTPFKHSCFV